MNETELGEIKLKEIAEMCKGSCHICRFGTKDMGDKGVECFFRWSIPNKWPLQMEILIDEG